MNEIKAFEKLNETIIKQLEMLKGDYVSTREESDDPSAYEMHLRLCVVDAFLYGLIDGGVIDNEDRLEIIRWVRKK